jgi:hypothetical protein
VRALITEIVVDIDEAAGEIVLVIHWKGGQHSELRVRKPRTGEHGCSTPEQALAIMRRNAAGRRGASSCEGAHRGQLRRPHR